MKNLKIGKKLAITFGTVIILFIVTLAVSILSLNSIKQSYTDFYDGPFNTTTTAMDVRRTMYSVERNIMSALLTTDDAETKALVDSARSDSTYLQTLLSELEKTFFGDKTLLQTIKDSSSAIADTKETIFQLALEQKNAEAQQLFLTEYQPVLSDVRNIAVQIGEASDKTAVEFYNSAISTATTSIVFTLIISIFVVIIIIIFAIYMTKSLTKPIKEIEAAAGTLSQGKLDAVITYESKDELGLLSNSMRKTVSALKGYIGEIAHVLGEVGKGNLRIESNVNFQGDFQDIKTSIDQVLVSLNTTLSQINIAADQVTNASEQVSAGSQELATGATEQASSIQELTATIENISQQVDTNANQAAGAGEQALNASNELEASYTQMQELVKAIDKINEVSKNISRIIKSIEDIAFQTNLLSLNAAIEAARAGEAGRGFSVVAEEIRELATQSADAAKNTTDLIRESVASVKLGVKIAGETAETLTGVVQNNKLVTSTIETIVTASREQAMTFVQISKAVEQISNVVQSNSATAEESAAASEELSAQAAQLKDLVSEFQIKG